MIATRNEIVIVGCGRWLYRDDQAGLVAAESLLGMRLPDVRIYATESPAADIALIAADARMLIVIDAARAGAGLPAGDWRRIDYHQNRPRFFEARSPSAHTLSVATALEVADSIGSLPAEVWIYAIGAASAEAGAKVSPLVARAVQDVISAVRRDVIVWHQKHAELSHA
jgi:hydrogenase maturation protease